MNTLLLAQYIGNEFVWRGVGLSARCDWVFFPWKSRQDGAKRRIMQRGEKWSKTGSLIVQLSVALLNESLSCLHPSVLMYAVYTSSVHVFRHVA